MNVSPSLIEIGIFPARLFVWVCVVPFCVTRATADVSGISFTPVPVYEFLGLDPELIISAAVKASYMDCEAGPREIEDPGKGVILAVLDGKVTGKANSTMVTGGTYVFGFYGEDGKYLGGIEIYQGLLVTDDGMYYID